ncbi:MAG: diaminopimelate decarboxylase [Rhodospirillales bacterium 69-11]|nr:MAG: diaminopimelate decarboxylase [Rhodospirillales bacterium 69-11]
MAAPSAPLDPAEDPSLEELVVARPFLSRHAFDGLVLEDVPLSSIADAVGTPTWVYGAGTMRARARHLRAALQASGMDVHAHYAVKANDHLAVLSLFAAEGFGADVVSEGELRRARAAGVPADRIVFSGVGKSVSALRLALGEEIEQINVESAEELEMISALAAAMGRTARVALRVNPDVDAGTHEKISTGRAQDKFGIPFAEAAALYARAAALPGVRPVGLAAHIGSQIETLEPYRAAFARLADLVHTLRAAGHAVETVDCGGGLGIPYRNQPVPRPEGLAAVLRGAFHNLDVRLLVEPGRWLVGPAGLLLASVILVKQTEGARFVVLDAGMNDLVRPAMYDSWHGILPIAAADLVLPVEPADVVGPICESSDTFARRRRLPPLGPAARVAILDAGAYGAVMSSAYNARPRAAEVMVDGDRWTVIRERPPLEALWADEHVPAPATQTAPLSRAPAPA